MVHDPDFELRHGRKKTGYEFLLGRELKRRITKIWFIRTLMIICLVQAAVIIWWMS
nr:MAG TPA: hypothetical protein [Caudoviricetes sp.]